MPTIRDYIMGKGSAPLPFGSDNSDPITSLNKNIEGLNSTVRSSNNTAKDLNRSIQNLLGIFKESEKRQKTPSKNKELIPFKNIEKQIKDIHQNFSIVVTNIKDISKNTKMTSQNLSGILRAIQNLSKENKDRFKKEDIRYEETINISKKKDTSVAQVSDAFMLERKQKEEISLVRSIQDLEKAIQKEEDKRNRSERQKDYSSFFNIMGLSSFGKIADRMYAYEKEQKEKDETVREKQDALARMREDLKRTRELLAAVQKNPIGGASGAARGGTPSGGSSYGGAQYVPSGIKGITGGACEDSCLSFIAPKIQVIESNTTKILKLLKGQGDEEEKDRNKTEHFMDRQLKVLEDIDDSLETKGNAQVLAKLEDKKKGFFGSLLDTFGGSLLKWGLTGAALAGLGFAIKKVTDKILEASNEIQTAQKEADVQNAQFGEQSKSSMRRIREDVRSGKMSPEEGKKKAAKFMEALQSQRRDEAKDQEWSFKNIIRDLTPDSYAAIKSNLGDSYDWIANNPWTAGGLAVGTGAAAQSMDPLARKVGGGVWGKIKSLFGSAPSNAAARLGEMAPEAFPHLAQQNTPGMMGRAMNWMSGKAGAATDFIKGGIDDLLAKAPDKITAMFKTVSGKASGLFGKVTTAVSGLGLKSIGKGIAKFIPFLNAGIVTNEIMTRLGSGDYLGAAVAATGYGGLLATAAGIGVNAILDSFKLKQEVDAEKAAKDEKLNDSGNDVKIRARLEELKKANPLKSMAEIKQMMVQEGTVSGGLSGRLKLQKIKELQATGKTYAEAKAIVEAGAIEGRAKGGPVKANTPYEVGEDGVELFVPQTNGTIIPNDVLSGFDVGRTNAAIKNYQKWDWARKGGENHPGYLASKRLPPLSQAVIDDFYFTGYTPGKGDLKMQGSGKATSIGDTPKTVEGFQSGLYRYVTAAVDPRVLPYGTVFAVDRLPGVPLIAADTGSAIQGTHIDIAFENMSNAKKITTSSGVIQKLGKIDLSKVSHKNMRGKLESFSPKDFSHALLSQRMGEGGSPIPSMGGSFPASSGTSFQGSSNTAITSGGAIPTSISNTASPSSIKDFETGLKNVSVPFISQKDPRWSKIMYSSRGDPAQTIGSSGCGIVSAAMVLNSFGISATPPELGKFSTEQGFRTADSGTAHSFFPTIGKKYGLDVVQIQKGEDVLKYLGGNIPIIASMGPGAFTKHGHFIVLRGISPSGKILVNDPNSADRSQKEWPLQIISQQGRNFWAFSKNGKGVSQEEVISNNISSFTPPATTSTPGTPLPAPVPGVVESTTAAAVDKFAKLSELITGSKTSEGAIAAAKEIKASIDSNEMAQTLGIFGHGLMNPNARVNIPSLAEMEGQLANPEFGMTGAEVARAKAENRIARAPSAAPLMPQKTPPAPIQAPPPPAATSGSTGGKQLASGGDPNVSDMYLAFLNTMNDLVA